MLILTAILIQPHLTAIPAQLNFTFPAATPTQNVAAAADDIAASTTASIILLLPEQASQSSCLQPQTQCYYDPGSQVISSKS